jgi:glycosyltransferase involved in cell wall biosynthesis
MPPITALLHTTNDALRLGRTLEMLLPCSEIVIVDHHSADATRRIARHYGARIIPADDHDIANHYLARARHDWILCMQPGESVTESLQASLFEWSALPPASLMPLAAFSVFVRQQTAEHWLQLPAPETRLIPRSWTRWHGRLPAQEPSAVALEGELLRFDLP